MDQIAEIKEQVADHEERLKKVEDAQLATLQAIGNLDTKHEQRLRDVKSDLTDRMANMDASAKGRDQVNAERLDTAIVSIKEATETSHRVEDKMDGTLQEVRNAPSPVLVIIIGALVGLLTAFIGGAIEYFIFKG